MLISLNVTCSHHDKADKCLILALSNNRSLTLQKTCLCFVFLLKFKWEIHVSIFKCLLFVILEGFKF